MNPSEHDELEHLAELCRQVDSIKEAIAQHVPKARAAGASWQEIGTALGMTKQGAQKRFGSMS